MRSPGGLGRVPTRRVRHGSRFWGRGGCQSENNRYGFGTERRLDVGARPLFVPKKGCSCVEGDVSVLQTEETVPVWSFVLAIPTFLCFKNPYCQEAVAHGSGGSDELLNSLTRGKQKPPHAHRHHRIGGHRRRAGRGGSLDQQAARESRVRHSGNAPTPVIRVGRPETGVGGCPAPQTQWAVALKTLGFTAVAETHEPQRGPRTTRWCATN